MSTLYNASLCLSDIPKEKVTISEKNGKKYLNVNVWMNDEPDQYGNIASINVSQTAEERAAKTKKVYIGNLKLAIKKDAAVAAPATAAVAMEDLPF